MWKSPLKKGMRVLCNNGLLVECLENPLWNDPKEQYDIRVEILDSGTTTNAVGTDKFVHKSPDRFNNSRFKEYWMYKSLEDEFFEREPA